MRHCFIRRRSTCRSLSTGTRSWLAAHAASMASVSASLNGRHSSWETLDCHIHWARRRAPASAVGAASALEAEAALLAAVTSTVLAAVTSTVSSASVVVRFRSRHSCAEVPTTCVDLPLVSHVHPDAAVGSARTPVGLAPWLTTTTAPPAASSDTVACTRETWLKPGPRWPRPTSQAIPGDRATVRPSGQTMRPSICLGVCWPVALAWRAEFAKLDETRPKRLTLLSV